MKSETRSMRYWPEGKSKREKVKSRERVLFALFLFTFSFGILPGCGLFTTRDDVPLKQATAEQLTALLQEQAGEVKTIKGLFSAKMTGGFTAVGSELFEFVQIDDQFKLRLPTMGREVIGRPSEADRLGNLTRPFQLSVWAMSGIIGTQAVGPQEQVQLTEDGDRYRLDVLARAAQNGTAPVVIRRIWFERRNLLVVQEERVSPAGEIEATMQFDDYRAVGASDGTQAATVQASAVDRRIMRPFAIRMTDGQGSGSLQVTFHELIPNEPLKPGDLGRV